MENLCTDITAPTVEFKHESGRMSWAWFMPSGYEGPWCKGNPFRWASQPSRLPLTNEWWTREVRCFPGEAPLEYSHTGNAPSGFR